RPVDRSGAGAVVEVYPAASLRGWGLRHRGYKRPRTPEVLAVAADDLLAAAPWLDCGPHEETIRRSHDAFDAVIAALTARAVSRGGGRACARWKPREWTRSCSAGISPTGPCPRRPWTAWRNSASGRSGCGATATAGSPTRSTAPSSPAACPRIRPPPTSA